MTLMISLAMLLQASMFYILAWWFDRIWETGDVLHHSPVMRTDFAYMFGCGALMILMMSAARSRGEVMLLLCGVGGSAAAIMRSYIWVVDDVVKQLSRGLDLGRCSCSGSVVNALFEHVVYRGRATSRG